MELAHYCEKNGFYEKTAYSIEWYDESQKTVCMWKDHHEAISSECSMFKSFRDVSKLLYTLINFGIF